MGIHNLRCSRRVTLLRPVSGDVFSYFRPLLPQLYPILYKTYLSKKEIGVENNAYYKPVWYKAWWLNTFFIFGSLSVPTMYVASFGSLILYTLVGSLRVLHHRRFSGPCLPFFLFLSVYALFLIEKGITCALFLAMTTNKVNDLLPHAKFIIECRTSKRMNWSAVARALITNEVAAGKRPADCWQSECITQLVLNYSRAAKKLFNALCAMGFAVAPDDTKTFGSGESGKSFLHPDAEDKLRDIKNELQLEEASNQSDNEYISVLKKAARSERERLRQLIRTTENRVRGGRPFMTRTEAAQSRPPRKVWCWKTKTEVLKTHPSLTDRELLGSERYDAIIAERVAEVKAREHSPLELFHAENPGAIPPSSGYHAGRRNGTYQLWEDTPEAEIERKAVLLTALVGTFLYPAKKGRLPIGETRVTLGQLCTLAMQQTQTFANVHMPTPSGILDATVAPVEKVVRQRHRKFNAPNSPKLWQQLEDYKSLFPAPTPDAENWVEKAYPKAVEFYALNPGLNI